jgi:hypothetical protein
MDTLLKLSGLWSTDHKVTFLRYIVQVVDSKVPSLARFYEDLPNVHRASEMGEGALTQHWTELEHLQRELDAAAAEVVACQGEVGSEAFAARLGGFVEETRGRLGEVGESLTASHASYESMLEYYGEAKGDHNGGKLFDILHEFCGQFKQEQAAQRKAEKVQASKAQRGAAAMGA